MKFKSEKLDSKYGVKYTITVDKEVIVRAHDRAIKQLGKDAKVDGFRRGHIPVDVLEKNIDQARLSGMEIDFAINESIIELLTSEDLQILDQPKVSVSKYVPKDTLEFTVELEVVPSPELADPKKLKVKKPEAKVDPKQIDDVVNRLRTSAAEKTVVEREAKMGDEVVIDFTGLKDGVEFAGGKATDYTLELGSGQFIPGFEEGIVGHKSGDKFDIDVTFPEDYGAKDLAGKKAVFQINLKKVYELKLPELDDKFAESISPDLKTMKALREDIERELMVQEEATAREKYHGELLDKLAEKSKVEVPEVLVDDQIPQMKQQFSQDLMYRGLDLKSYLAQIDKTEEQWEKEDLRTSAEKRIRNSLVLRQFIKSYDITVSEADIDEYRDKILARYNNPKMKENFQTDEYRRQIREQLLIERANARLAELNESK